MLLTLNALRPAIMFGFRPGRVITLDKNCNDVKELTVFLASFGGAGTKGNARKRIDDPADSWPSVLQGLRVMTSRGA